MKKPYKSKCKTCGNALQKRGKTAAGSQRYFCVNCAVSSTVKKSYLSKRSELKMFLDWVLGKKTREEASKYNRRTFANKTKWCWYITPVIDSKT
jgi:transposase-like protein